MRKAARKIAVPKTTRKLRAGARPKPQPEKARRKPTPRSPKIDVLVESSRWTRQAAVRAMARRAVVEAAAALSTPQAELAIVLTDDSAIRLLNREWRGVNSATNVLSFPTGRGAAGPTGAPPFIGDIVLAYETIAREAEAEQKPFAHHVAHLAVHGFLHLLGYDHTRTAQAETMERKERAILRRLAIPDPYRLPR